MATFRIRRQPRPRTDKAIQMRNILFTVLGVGAAGGCMEIPQPKADDTARAAFETFSYGAPTGFVSAIATGDPGAPRVIFIHGTPGGKGAFADYLANVPRGRRYISYDRPGFGDSAPQGAAPRFDEQLDAILPLVSAPGGRKPILVGHSLGGPLALYAAAMHPEAFAGVVVLAGSADPALERIHPMQYVGDTWLGAAVLPRALFNSNKELFMHKAELLNLANMLDDIRLPVVVIHGEEDQLVPVANVDFMRERLPEETTDFVVIEDADHFFIWREQHTPRVAEAIDQIARRAWGE